jgi:hypothetical protein
MTKRKKTVWDAMAGGMGVSALMAANVEAIEAAPEIALDWFPEDEDLRRAVEAGDVPMVVARVMELTMRETPAAAARLEASIARSAATSDRNVGDAAAVRAAKLRTLDRHLAAGRSLADALTLGWPDSKSDRDRVREWHREREARRNK